MTPCTGCLSLARCQLLGFPLTPQYQTLLTLILFLTLKHTQLLYVGLYSHLHFYRLYLFIGLSCTFLGNWNITLSVFVNNPLPTKRVRHVLCVIPLPSIFSLSLENILAIQHLFKLHFDSEFVIFFWSLPLMSPPSCRILISNLQKFFNVNNTSFQN